MHPDLQAKLAALTPAELHEFSDACHQLGVALSVGALDQKNHLASHTAAATATAMPPWLGTLLKTLGPLGLQLLESLLAHPAPGAPAPPA